MDPSQWLDGFDIEITLRDEALNPDNRPERRALANLVIGMEIQDAYYSIRQLREAISETLTDNHQRNARLAAILGEACDDFQRAIYYALAGRGTQAMLDELIWVEAIAKSRAETATAMMARRTPRHRIRQPLSHQSSRWTNGSFPHTQLSRRIIAFVRDGSGNLSSADVWIANVTAVMLTMHRRKDEQATTPEPQPDIQGQGGVVRQATGAKP